MRKLALLSTVLILTMFFQNCAPSVKFSEDSVQLSSLSDPATSIDTPTVSEKTEAAVQSFSSETTQKAIDMVWVIDNSASMTQNVANVKKNFKAFIQSLESSVDVRVALISRAQAFSYNTQISLSDYTSSGLQVPFLVHSYNPMLVAAAATCPASPKATDAFCTTVQSNSRYANVYGSLNSFFRDGSQKVFVFVSDDDSSIATKTSVQFDSATSPSSGSIDVVSNHNLVENVDYIEPATFTGRMQSAFGSSSAFKSFGFIAYDKAKSPCLARPGTKYQSLIESSLGSHYNICDTDWSSSFNSLTKSVVNYAASNYTVADAQLKSIDSVALNGAPLMLGQDYAVNGNVITLSSALIASVGSYSISVHYTRVVSQ